MSSEAIRWWSQPFPPEGGGTAEGIKRALGRPSLPEFAILVREAVQNSWDARTGDRILFKISLRKLGSDAIQWRHWIGASSDSDQERGLLAGLHSDSWILTVSDRGTSGLGGPLRSDEPDKPDQVANFVQFIRNVGEPRDKDLGGGTYGFGKGIFYRISEAGAILVDTLNTDGDESSRRLMGAALGGIETDGTGRRFTGRHWWGAINDDIPDPVTGDAAAQIADQLGLPGFRDGITGTDVTVILPNLELDEIDGDVELLAARLRAHIYWYLWPKLVGTPNQAGIDFELEVNGVEYEFPELKDMPVFSSFESALVNLRAAEGTDFTMASHMKKYGFLGHLSIERTMPSMYGDRNSVWESMQATAPIEAPYRHIARMRQAELIVDYFPGEPMSTTNIGYVGAFVASATVDEFFAQAEPPTHDGWETGALVGPAKGIVQRSKTWLGDQCRQQVEATSGTRSKAVQGLGRLSSSLGAFVAGAAGTRPTPAKGKSAGSGPGRKRASAYEVRRQSHVVVSDQIAYVDCEVEIAESVPEGLLLTAEASVILASGRKENPFDAPAGAAETAVLYWYFDGNANDRIDGPVLDSAHMRPGRWTARARALDDVSVRVTVRDGG
ncbi:hypothetical protein [Jongsikchunia kroppenstedtii]|uniref:hypothetical protein n=1 Tax=Jongsikchunia kroppenstedtii TaxID=1121721 RepID=UPI00037E0C03|nr:hypothetical protein [Jongsikchunia kroppenstedtii]